MRLLFIGILLVLGLNFCFAQGLMLTDARSGAVVTETTSTTIAGSPYLTERWGIGFVYVNEKLKTENTVQIRYDIYSDKAQILDAGNVYALDAGKIRGFKFSLNTEEGVREYHFKNGFSKITSISPKAYFEVLYEGKNTFLKRHTKTIGFSDSNYGSSNSKAFKDETICYVIKENGEVVEFAENKRALLKAFPLKEKEISKYMKDNSIKISESEDLKDLSRYIDTLSQ